VLGIRKVPGEVDCRYNLYLLKAIRDIYTGWSLRETNAFLMVHNEYDIKQLIKNPLPAEAMEFTEINA
jgi:hypothetical protein